MTCLLKDDSDANYNPWGRGGGRRKGEVGGYFSRIRESTSLLVHQQSA